MKRVFRWACALCYLASLSFLFAQNDRASQYASTIKVNELFRHILVLSSDSLEGRETGERGQKKAAHYLAKQFKAVGLRPASVFKNQPSYYQQFSLKKAVWNQVYIRIKNKKYVHLKNMLYLSNSTKIRAEQFEVIYPNQTKNIETKGKLIAYLVDSIGEWRQKTALARKLGAIGAVVFVKNKRFKSKVEAYRPYLDARYSLVEEKGQMDEEFTLILPASAFRSFFETSYRHPEKIKSRAAKFICKASAHNESLSTENVVGYIEGSTKRDELLVITAHYDHLGFEKKHIYRGADDNGSGTAALIEIAEAFSIAKEKGNGPARSILFMAMTGEEKGLLGSGYYTQHPIFPLNQTVANLNIDMIGRIDANHIGNPNYVYLIGSDKLSSELHNLSEQANNRYTKLLLDYTFNDENDPNRFYYRSDHYNFAKNGVPVIFYFSGVHEDYHEPSDTADKLLLDKYSRIVKLIFYTAWEIANRAERPKVDKM